MSNRLDREIDEILSEYEKNHDRTPVRLRTGKVWRTKRRLSRWRPSIDLPGITAPQLMLAGAVLVLFGFFFAAFLPSTLERWIVMVGAVMAIAGFFLAFLGRRSGSTVEKRWRGQVIRMPEQGRGSRFRGWFNRK